MKSLLLAFTLFASPLFASSLDPLWMDDKPFRYYRCMIIESSILHIEDLMYEVSFHRDSFEEVEQIMTDIEIIKINLGIAQY